MTEKGVGSRFRGNDVAPGRTLETGLAPRLWRYRAEWIPAYAGMTMREGMTIMECGRDDNEGRNGDQPAPARRPRDGARSAPSPNHPQALVIPAKAGTYRRAPAHAQAGTYPNAARPDRSTLSRRVRGVLSPYESFA